jgi:hypothetical protein
MNDTATKPYSESVIRMMTADFRRVYGVVLKFNNATKIHFEIIIRSLPQQEDNLHVFEIDRQQVYVNDKAPDLLIDKLADDLGKILYPLKVVVNTEGFVIAISNLKDIQQRFEKEKEALHQYYIGEIATAALNKTERIIANEKLLLDSLKNDWFLAVYFSGIYGLKAFDFRIWSTLKLPVFPYKPLTVFKIKREITEQHTEDKSLTIVCSGEVERFDSNENVGEVLLKYDLYHKDFSINAITGYVSLTTEMQPEKRIDIEIFHLREKDSSLQN